MLKLDLSVLRENGFRINKLRLFHSFKLRGMNFVRNKQQFIDIDDLVGERNIITEYLTENNEIIYTQHLIYSLLSFIILISTLVLFLTSVGLTIKIVPLITSFILFLLSKKSYTNFVMGNMGIEMSESFFDFKIKNNYNL